VFACCILSVGIVGIFSYTRKHPVMTQNIDTWMHLPCPWQPVVARNVNYTLKRGMKTRKSTSGGYLSALVHRLFAHLTALLIFIVSIGPIPKHVAFVMDGNRRYARGKGQKVREGHTEGFESLKRVDHLIFILGYRRLMVDFGNMLETQDPCCNSLRILYR